MNNYEKIKEMNERIKTLLLERGVKVLDNRTTEELERDLLRCCQKLGIKLKSSEARVLEKKYNLFLGENS